MTMEITREEIVRRFEAMLDTALTSETAPSGIDAQILSSVMEGGQPDESQRYDVYALWAAVTALTQEIKLQGRAFQELNLTLAAQAGKIGDELRAVYVERERSAQREAERRSRRDALRALIDLRDRLMRGLESVRLREREIAVPQKVSVWERLFGKPKTSETEAGALSALVRGYELGVQRLDQTLDEFGAREVPSQGERFDPRSMNAIDSEVSTAVPAGTVVEVFLAGYEWNGEVFRPAQVKVSRVPGEQTT